MKPAGLFVGAVGLVMAVGCAHRTPAPAPDEAAARPASSPGPQTPEDVDRLFGERMNAGDLDGLVALYEPTGTLVKFDGSPAMGSAAIRDDLAEVLKIKPKITMNVKKVVSGGDVAVLYNDWHLKGVDPKGKTLKLSGRASEVVRRQADGTWRFVIDDPDARGRR